MLSQPAKICTEGKPYLTFFVLSRETPWKCWTSLPPMRLDKGSWSDQCQNITISPLEITRMDKWVLEACVSDTIVPSKELIASVLWFIWKARNDHVFQARKPDPSSKAEATLTMNKNHVRRNLGTGKHNHEKNYSPVPLRPPDRGFLKFNTDGAWLEGASEGSTRVGCW